MKKLLAMAALIGTLGIVSAGCSPMMARTVVAGAVVGAAIVGTAHVLQNYDVAYHRRHCYHTRRWYDGRWVYRCRGRTVYYDDGTWYAYD